VPLDFANGGISRWMPVAHSDRNVRMEVAPQDVLEGVRLTPRVLENRASAADLAVMRGYMLGAPGRDQPRKGLARDAGEREVYDVRVAEEVV